MRGSVTVYPRSRGEHAFNFGDNQRGCGLSPLARGTRESYGMETDAERFIPARAGNTHR